MGGRLAGPRIPHHLRATPMQHDAHITTWRETREALVRQWMPLAIRMAKRMLAHPSGQRLGIDDLIAVAYGGLVRALADWNPALGNYSTHAGWKIRAALSHALQREARRNREYVASSMEWTEDALEVSIEQTWPDDDAHGPEGTMLAGESDERFEAMLGRLPEREALALRLRLKDGLSLAEAGDVLGVTKERVRQISLNALARLRQNLGAAPQPRTRREKQDAAVRHPVLVRLVRRHPEMSCEKIRAKAAGLGLVVSVATARKARENLEGCN